MSYNIDQFSKITGINKLVLRTWENRYGLLKAKRTSTNIRIYSDELLITALNIKLLIDSGYKISFIAKQSNQNLIRMIAEIKSHKNEKISETYYINKLIESATTYNSSLFHKTYNDAISQFGINKLYQEIILSTFSKVGILWLTNRINPGQEHFLSELIKQKILASIETISFKKRKSKKWLLFLPMNEHHEIGLIFAKLLLIQNGYEVIYLGANVPDESLVHISMKKKIDNILLFSISNFSKKRLKKTISMLNDRFKKSKTFVVANLTIEEHSNIGDQVNIISNIKDFLQIIN